ncbi:MAG: GNAT family N-acetyltransferase [bacterium]
MIRYVKYQDIDETAWDKCIRKSFNGLVYAYSWYLDIVHDEWDALVEGDYERVMPLTGNRKWGISYLFQPYFVQQLGVFSKNLLTPEITGDFLKNIPAHYRYIDIRMNSFNKVDDEGFTVFYHKNHLLDLINSYEKIAARYSTQTKRNLKNSGKYKLTLMKNIKPESIVKLFRENRGKGLAKWSDRHYSILRTLMYAAIYKGMGVAYGVFSERNELCAGTFFLKSKNRLIFLFSGADEAARQNSAMTFLIDSVIRAYARHQVVLDFEGSDNPQLARFYRGFGASEITYPGLLLNRLPFPLRPLLDLRRKLKK